MILFLHDQAESNTISLMIHMEEFSLKEKALVLTFVAFHLFNKVEFLLVLKSVKLYNLDCINHLIN